MLECSSVLCWFDQRGSRCASSAVGHECRSASSRFLQSRSKLAIVKIRVMLSDVRMDGWIDDVSD